MIAVNITLLCINMLCILYAIFEVRRFVFCDRRASSDAIVLTNLFSMMSITVYLVSVIVHTLRVL